jgi:hypothetical protein
MTKVAKNRGKYTMKRLFEELFDWCFPVNFRSMQRDTFSSFEQDGMELRVYEQKLITLANSIGGISKRSFVLQFWKGLDSYLRFKFSEKGLSGETSSIEELMAKGQRFELAHRLKQTEGRVGRRNSSMGDKLWNKDSEPESDGGSSFVVDKSESHGRNTDFDLDQEGTSSSEGRERHGRGRRPRPGAHHSNSKRLQLSREEREELRAENRCFSCKQKGHIARDCPDRNTPDSSEYEVEDIENSDSDNGDHRNEKAVALSGMFLNLEN